MPRGVYERKLRPTAPSLTPVNCKQCGAPFLAKRYKLKAGQGQFCSPVCRSTARQYKLPTQCAHCGTAFTITLSQRRRRIRHCSRACQAAGSRKSLAERLWPRGERHPRFGCLMYTGALSAGYGELSSGNGGNITAPRAAWVLTYGPIPEGLFVCHKCDVYYPPGDITYRRCFEPTHLFLGTHSDNMRDMLKKGRGRWRARTSSGAR
jgi:hypothetical protein